MWGELWIVNFEFWIVGRVGRVRQVGQVRQVGHILLDDVPAGRPKKKDSNCSLWK